MLTSLISCKANEYIMIGNDDFVPITNSGNTMQINKSPISLHDVLVVPQIKKNLVSISKLTKDFPCYHIY